jgi:hypothetical protein
LNGQQINSEQKTKKTETKTYRSDSTWFLHHLDPILCINFSFRSGFTEKPTLAVTDPTIYLARNGEAFNIPNIEPPAYLVIPARSTNVTCKELCASNAAASKAWNTYKVILTTTRNQFAAPFNNIYYAILDDPTKGINTINLCTFIMHILNTYAQISQLDLDDKMTDFHSGINSDLPLTVYTETGKMLGLRSQCQSLHLQQNHDHHRYQTCPSVRQQDIGLALVEILPAYQPHVAQLESLLDRMTSIA